AGPLHGVAVARMLDIPEVIVPPFPGITSAMGLLTTDLKYDLTRTQFQVSGAVDLERINNDIAAMESELSAQFTADKIVSDDVSFQRIGDLRYVGQGYELKITFPDGIVTEEGLNQTFEAFHRAHAAEYGHAFKASPIEIVNLRVSGIGRMPKIEKLRPPAGGTLAEALVRTDPSVFRVAGELKSFDTPVYRRTALPVGEIFYGPAIILHKDSTTVMPPATSAVVDATGSIIITLGEAK
ncbi:MAG: hydantoinase/oxoprolinase family protein, partial [Hyphomicrobiales bacterium]